MSPRRNRAELQQTVTVLAVAVAASAVIAATVAIAFGAQARGWLQFTFEGIPDRPGEVLDVLGVNARLALAPVALVVVYQALGVHELSADRTAKLAVRTAGDALLASAVGINLLVVGAAVGGYGWRMAKALLPHAPFELAAFALLAVIYLQGRRHAVEVAWAARLVVLAGALLAVAACLEVYG